MQRKNHPIPKVETPPQTTRRRNLERKRLKCLGCGRMMVTDRCHHFCRVCQRRNRRGQYYLPKQTRIGVLGSAE